MKKILILDDDKDILNAIVYFLKHSGYDVRAASSRQEFYLLLTSYEPDLIFIDVLLDGYDGRMICKDVKLLNGSKPIIIMSSSPVLLLNYLKFDANDFLLKPFDMDYILVLVKRWLK